MKHIESGSFHFNATLPNAESSRRLDDEKTIDFQSQNLEKLNELTKRFEQIEQFLSSGDTYNFITALKKITKLIEKPASQETIQALLSDVGTLVELFEKEVSFSKQKYRLYKKIESIYPDLNTNEQADMNLADARTHITNADSSQANSYLDFEKNVDAKKAELEQTYIKTVLSIREKIALLQDAESKGMYAPLLVRLNQLQQNGLPNALEYGELIIHILDTEIKRDKIRMMDIEDDEEDS